MKTTLSKLLAVAVLSGLVASGAAAQEEKAVTLKPGDPAPPLAVSKWVKGEPVKKLEKGKVYVIECWATWCGPCVQAIPHVTELQKKYKDKDLVVIGMNVWENDDAAVEPFVKKMGDKMDYRVAMDDKSGGSRGKMAETWMQAAGRNGIPCSFIVDRDTKIAWIGHPMQMDRPLEQIIAGKFDAKKEGELTAKRDAALKQYQAGMQAKEYDKAMAAVDEIIAADPDNAAMYRPAKLQILMQKKDYKAANKMAKELLDGKDGKTQQMAMNVAFLMAQADSKEVDQDLLIAAAERAASEGGQIAPMAKSIAAKGHANKGDYDKAVKLQQEAVDAVPGPGKQQFEADLETYKQKAKEKGAGGATGGEKKEEAKQ
jgi:thiol-disulfide isomerase/thioredoxin